MNNGICEITGASIVRVSSAGDTNAYDINLFGLGHRLTFCRTCYRKIEFQKYKHILHGFLLNHNLAGKVIHWEPEDPKDFDLKKEIEEGDYPKSPGQKLDNLLLWIFQQQNSDGELIDFQPIFDAQRWFQFYFKNNGELSFYLDTLLQQDLIRKSHTGNRFGLTFKGLAKVASLEDEGNKSKNCFVAMSFDKDDSEIYDAINSACIETGFEAKKIDDEHYDSDKTINDAMIALIKKCKFCIADFTKQKDGVYFEAGYALGRQMKVIYTCKEVDFNKSHFDTNHFPHIIYANTEELKKKLVDKIDAWIK